MLGYGNGNSVPLRKDLSVEEQEAFDLLRKSLRAGIKDRAREEILHVKWALHRWHNEVPFVFVLQTHMP